MFVFVLFYFVLLVLVSLLSLSSVYVPSAPISVHFEILVGALARVIVTLDER